MFPLFLLISDLHMIQAGEGDYHGRAREGSRDQRGGKAPGEPGIILVLKAVGAEDFDG